MVAAGELFEPEEQPGGRSFDVLARRHTGASRKLIERVHPVAVPQTFDPVDLRLPDDAVGVADHPLPAGDELLRRGQPVRTMLHPRRASSMQLEVCAALQAVDGRLATAV